MNNYISASEKAQLIRVILMEKVLQDAIATYANLDSTDKAFLGELRHGRTRIDKAIKLRRLSLDNDADDKLLAGAAKLEPMFLARPEAKKAHKELIELQSILPMDIEDLQDWYGFVIEFTCRNCTRGDYTDCPARRVLTKYEICPMDPGAKDKCQYSYVGVPEADELHPVDTDKTVPALVYNAALAMVRAKEDSINENYVPAINQLDKEISATKEQIKSLQEKNANYIEKNQELYAEIAEYDRLKMVINDILHPNGDGPINPSMCDLVAYIRGDRNQFTRQISDLQNECDRLIAENKKLTSENEQLTIEQIKENIYGCGDNEDDHDYEICDIPVILGLNNGNKVIIHIPEYMTSKLIEEIQRPVRSSRGTIAQFIDNELIVVDMQEVITMQISDIQAEIWERPLGNIPAYEFTTEKELYHVECKCGSEYFATMNVGRSRANCRDCKYTVFADRSADKIISPTDGAKATLLTNRYFVTNEPHPAVEQISKTVSELQDIKVMNYDHGYQEQCVRRG